jgi:two-component system chemotaxis response regulator CheB
MAKIRVLVVDDSITVRKRLIDVIQADPDLQVVGEAEDGKAAIAACERLRPDVVTLDMMLPVMTGLAATEYIMAHFPTPILIISASTNRGELFRTYDALAAGAVDVLEKPGEDEPVGEWEAKLLATVKLVSRIKVITHIRGKTRALPASVGLHPEPDRGAPAACQLVAIGASTGGPAALVEIFRSLPPTFPLPILLVIHIGESFAAAFADWLDGLSALRVAYAKDGEPLPRPSQGRIIVAPPDRHLELRNGALVLSHGPERHSCRPSVDVLFESLAREIGARCAACLLTGMGKDGATGLLALRRAGATTIAQDEATSVIFGMPQEAIRLGAAERVLPLGEIARALKGLAPQGSRRSS